MYKKWQYTCQIFIILLILHCFRNEEVASLDELDKQAAEYMTTFMAKTITKIGKQATINKEALVKIQRKRYYLTVSAVIVYLLAFLLGVSIASITSHQLLFISLFYIHHFCLILLISLHRWMIIASCFIFQKMGLYWTTQRATSGVLGDIFAGALEDGAYDAELLHDIVPGGRFELPDTSCLNQDTFSSIYEGSQKIEHQFLDLSKHFSSNGSNNSNPNTVSKSQKLLTDAGQFKKKTEVSYIY